MKCLQCGTDFEPKRSTAKFHSDNCKLLYNRNKSVSVSKPLRNDTLSKKSDTLTLKVDTVKLTDTEKYLHLLYEECDGKNCPGGFVPNWLTANFQSKKDLLAKLK